MGSTSALSTHYDVVPLDRRSKAKDSAEVPHLRIVDLANNDRSLYREHFKGAETVVHCALARASDQRDESVMNGFEARFQTELTNVSMAYNVYQAAVEENVGRVVMASSNHATNFYENLIWNDRWDFITPEMLPRSENYYGWAKSACEELGFVFATGGGSPRRLEVVQIRIGDVNDNPFIHAVDPSDLKGIHRRLGAYLSRRDQAQLFIKSIDAPDILDASGVPFQIFYGISANSHRFWSIANAREVIGYAPEDNSQVEFGDQLATMLGSLDMHNIQSESSGIR